MEKSEDHSLPLYERKKFLAIHASNLDEFYRLRVAYMESKTKPKEYNHEEQVSSTDLLGITRDEANKQGHYLSTIL